jgi:GR25 family glycosyltransferase involved in LPS biosynthesis
MTSFFPILVTKQFTYVINLKRRCDRKRLIEYKLSKIHISPKEWKFFEAIDGLDETYDDIYTIMEKKNRFTSKGAFGLCMTYINMLEDAYKNNYDRILVLEDDINIHKQYHKLIQKFSNIINDGIHDIIWLGANQKRFSAKQTASIGTTSTYHPEPHKNNYTYGTYSMIINKSGIIKMMNIINRHNVTNLKPIDIMINDMIRSKILTSVVCYPFLFMPDVSDSDNMGPRNQSKFADSRGYTVTDYNYISQRDITNIQKYLDCDQSYDRKKLKSYKQSYNRLMEIVKNKNDLLYLLGY